MKRYVLVWILLLALVLTACEPALQPDPTNAAQPTESAVTPTLPTSPPAKPDSEQLQAYYAWQETRRGEDFVVFRYDGVLPENVNAKVDTTGMIVGYLYVFDFAQGKIVQVSHTASTELYDYNHYWGNVYYVTEDEPYRVFVATYNRELGEIVGTYSPYVSNGSNITALQHYGTNQDDGKLLICEEGRVIISYDMRIDDTEVLMEAYSIEEFSYSPSSLYSDSFAENVSSDEMGDVIYWRGKLNEADADFAYYYIVQKDEQWVEKEWAVKEAGPLPVIGEGFAFIFDGSNPTHYNDVDLSKCAVGSLYYIDVTTRKVYFVTDKSLVTYNSSGTHVFYVPMDEPSRIYAAPLTDLAQHTPVYESANGKITDSLFTGSFQHFNTALQFVEDDRRYIWLDLTTGKAEVVLEQYYILKASVDSSSGVAIDENGQPYLESTNVIYFMGKLNEADDLSQYLYYRDTGKIEEVFWQ